jgi:glycosyltransferase involved in cell wall biosynthesis
MLSGSVKMPKQKLMLFDLGVYGHHSSYILCLLEYYLVSSLDIHLDIVISRHFQQAHYNVIQLASTAKNINFIPITQAEQEQFDRVKSKLKIKFKDLLNTQEINSIFELEFNLCCQYAESLKSTHIIILYLDDGRMMTATKTKFPCPFSGIYFTPQFHYPQFSEYPTDNIKEAYYLQQKLIIARFIRHSQLRTLFCLDPFATEQIQNKYKSNKVVYLPDPVRVGNFNKIQLKTLRTSLKIEPNRKVFLLFGSLGNRKGIYQVLKAILSLQPEVCQQICLLLVGKPDPNTDSDLLKERVSWVREAQPVQIIEYYQFVPDSQVLSYFQLADIVLATYPRHAGMSGILFLAATAGKPVLSSNFGLMGEMTRCYQLGITVDAISPKAIAQGLKVSLQAHLEELCNLTKMQHLIEQHSPKKFAEILFNS